MHREDVVDPAENGIDNSRMKLTECAVPGVVGNCLDACPCLVQRFSRVKAWANLRAAGQPTPLRAA